MNIAIVSVSLPAPDRKPAGVDVAIHRLANELAQNPLDQVTVLSLDAPPVDAAYHHQPLFSQHPWLKRSKLGRLFIFPFLLNFVDFSAFDVVHFHGDDWFYVRRPIPSLRTLHGSALNEARSATSLKRKIAQSLVYPLEHLSARLATTPLAIGTDTATIYHIKTLVDNGVNPRLFYPGEKTPRPSILFVGTWEGRKRGKFIFELFVNQILSAVPNATLHMVSDVCPAHPSVVDVRFPSDTELATLFRQAWVFAYPSIYEGFGIAYLEALASGTAIVCSNNVGAEYVLDQGQYGIIAEDDSFGQRVIHLLQDPRQRSAWENQGRRRAAHFSWGAVAARHREIYAEAALRFNAKTS